MKPPQLEILLLTNTRFSSRQFCEKNGAANQNISSKNKNLEAACWNGLFKEMLPELYMDPRIRQKLILWKVVKGEHFLNLEYGDQPQIKEKHLSLDPYYFLGFRALS